MNEIWSSEALPPEKDMRYRLIFVSVHEGQGGGCQEHETKKKGRKRGRKDEAHYYGYLCKYVFFRNGTKLMTMMLMMWRKMICC